MTQENALKALHRATQKELEARLNRERLIREAHGEGVSLRRIAEVAGVSHEQVRVIVSR